MDVSIIVVNYNTVNLTLDCIDSIYRETTNKLFEVVLWDNNSQDRSKFELRDIDTRYDNLSVIFSMVNIGFAQANNFASKRAHGRYILLLNPDTVVLDNAIDRLVEFADATPDYDIFGGSTFWPDGCRNPTSCWGRPTIWSMFTMSVGFASIFRRSRLFNPESYSWWKWDRPREVDIVTGCFLLIRRDLWTNIRGFDPGFFMYGEDADLCLRARSNGSKCIVYPEAKIIHYEGASEKIRADKMIRLFRAKDQLLEKHYSLWEQSYGKLMLNLYALSRWIISGLLGFFSPTFREKCHTWSKVYQARKKRTGDEY